MHMCVLKPVFTLPFRKKTLNAHTLPQTHSFLYSFRKKKMFDVESREMHKTFNAHKVLFYWNLLHMSPFLLIKLLFIHVCFQTLGDKYLSHALQK